MRLDCPFCGERDGEEFVCRGEARGPRPDPLNPDAADAFEVWLHGRENPAGPNRELWYHAAGCRRWLDVIRDTRTFAVLSIRLAGAEDAQ